MNRLRTSAAVIALGVLGAACGATSPSATNDPPPAAGQPAGPATIQVSYVPATTVLPSTSPRPEAFPPSTT